MVLLEVLVFISRIPNPHKRRFSILDLCPLDASVGLVGGSEEGERGEDLVLVLVLVLSASVGLVGGSEGGEEDSQKHLHRAPIYVLSSPYPCWSPKKSFGNTENTMDRRTKVSFYFGI